MKLTHELLSFLTFNIYILNAKYSGNLSTFYNKTCKYFMLIWHFFITQKVVNYICTVSQSLSSVIYYCRILNFKDTWSVCTRGISLNSLKDHVNWLIQRIQYKMKINKGNIYILLSDMFHLVHHLIPRFMPWEVGC